MKAEQPALGRVGADSLSLQLGWHWEGGWSVLALWRLSGSDEWHRRLYEGLSADEAVQLLEDVSTDVLGLR